MPAAIRKHSFNHSDVMQLIQECDGDSESLCRYFMDMLNAAFKEGKSPSKKKTDKQQKEAVYLESAAKLIPYPIDIDFRHISVPMNKEQEAKDDITVSFLVNNYGFKIQLCIPDEVELKPVFDPGFTERIVRVKDESIEHGDEFKSPKSPAIIKIIGSKVSKKSTIMRVSFSGIMRLDDWISRDLILDKLKSGELIRLPKQTT